MARLSPATAMGCRASIGCAIDAPTALTAIRTDPAHANRPALASARCAILSCSITATRLSSTAKLLRVLPPDCRVGPRHEHKRGHAGLASAGGVHYRASGTESDILLPHFISDIFRLPAGQRHDRQRWIFSAASGELAAVGDE